MKKTITAFLSLIMCVLMLASCASEPVSLSNKLTEVPGEEPPVVVPPEWSADFAVATDEELAYYMNGYETLKNEITSSKSTIEIPEGATVYYVSNNGNNDNDGLSPETPFKTVSKINVKANREGDIVLFECGSVFRESLTLNKGVTYSSYGEGEKPRFYGSWDASDPAVWLETDVANVYEYDKTIPTELDVGQIVFDGGKQWGIKVMKRNAEDKRVNQGECFNGVDTFDNGEDVFASYKDLKSNLEFYCDPTERKMYLYCEYGNPAEHFESIEVVKRGNLCSGTAKDVVVDNLCFMYGGSHGIGVGNARNFEVKYCEFYYIGGSIQGYDIFGGAQPTRFGNAVENWSNCENFKIHHCYADQIYDCCYTTQWQGDSNGSDVIMKDAEFSYNISEHANTGLEVWMSDNVGYENATYKFENFDMHHNYTMYSGFGWSHQRPNKDSNFFYGGLNTNSTQHVNSVFHDNVNMFSTKYGLFARYTIGEPYGHVFRDNVYFMEYGKFFADSASVTDGVVGDNFNYVFDEYGIETAVKAGIDTSSKFRYTLPELDEEDLKPVRYTLDEYIKYNPHYTFSASSGNTYPVYIIKPENFEESKKYPLIVYLHAEYQGGDNGTSHVLNNNPIIQAMYTESTDDDAIILAMQVPKDGAWTNTDKRAEIYDYNADSAPAAISDLNELVDLVIAGEGGVKVDAKNVSIVGQSNGGTAVYDILTRYPGKYVRAAIAGAAMAQGANVGDTKVKVYHGARDIFFDEDKTSDYVSTLGANVEYKCIEAADHTVWSRAFDHDLCMWLIGK